MKWSAGNPGAPAAAGGRGNNVNNRRYGGDIQGVREELPYLRSLGVTCLYPRGHGKGERLFTHLAYVVLIQMLGPISAVVLAMAQ
jgi:hypothetical protein